MKHGHSREGKTSRVYVIYGGMVARCENPKQPNYRDYGGRGIKICPRWRGAEGFQNFLADLGEPAERMTLDRIDNDGDYCPENCRWATWETQHRNSRRTRNVTYHGVTMCVLDWSVKLGINLNTLYKRLNNGWTVEKSFTEPINLSQRRTKGESHVSGTTTDATCM